MDPEVNAAMSRVAVAMEERNESQVGLRIPVLVSAIIDQEADDELLDLVRTAMSSNDQSITMSEFVSSTLNLFNWRNSNSVASNWRISASSLLAWGFIRC